MRATRKYKSLPHNSKLKPLARHLRKAGMLHEVLLWQRLKKGQLNNLDFDRQIIIGDYIVDFYCAVRNTVVEIDGTTHNRKRASDEQKDSFLGGLGLTVIRISAEDVFKHLDEVVVLLRNHPALSGTPPGEGNSPFENLAQTQAGAKAVECTQREKQKQGQTR